MSRKIIEQLFPQQKNQEEEKKTISQQEWKDFMSRLEHLQLQIETVSEKTQLVYNTVTKWLNAVREKIENLSQKQEDLDKSTAQALVALEKKVIDWVQPDQRKEDQRRMMSLMQSHRESMQSYSIKVNSVKKTVSKNEQLIYQLLDQMRTVQLEMDILNRHKQTRSSISSPVVEKNQEKEMKWL